MAGNFRWHQVEEQLPQTQLFNPDEGSPFEQRKGVGKFEGIEFLHVNAKKIINEVPSQSMMPFRFTINAYRGCSHACVYCQTGDTPILMGDGRIKQLSEVRAGDVVYGTEQIGCYRRYVLTEVKDHWQTMRRAFRTTLSDGTTLISSGDHRYLSDRGWKFVADAPPGQQRPHLTLNNRLIGTGHFPEPAKHSESYKRGYLCGMIRGDGNLGVYNDSRLNRVNGKFYRFRLALALSDHDALERSEEWLAELGVPTIRFKFSASTDKRQEMSAIRNSTRAAYEIVTSIIEWPPEPDEDWRKGFLSGIFDAEGHHGQVVRICNTDDEMIRWTEECLDALGFDWITEPPRTNGCRNVRILGGMVERIRFFITVDPAQTRKRSFDGLALKNQANLFVTKIEDLGFEMPMYDITTSTGDFIANGVVSHNCFARPTHAYLDLDIGKDFETKIVVKVNAAEKLRAELRHKNWSGDGIAMGTNTDPYQRAEGKYQLTRRIIQELSEARNPFSILTKGTLVTRDLDVLIEANKRTKVSVNFSIPTVDTKVWRATEPGTPNPLRRIDALNKLTDAGIECGVLMAPIIPGLSDSPEQMNEVIDRCRVAGASWVTPSALHLKPGVKEHWMKWLMQAYPKLVPKYKALYANKTYLDKETKANITKGARRYGQSDAELNKT